ncbi:hypothetical protein PMAYCL1PPCAC_22267, partial [Pristionchus mayeri]
AIIASSLLFSLVLADTQVIHVHEGCDPPRAITCGDVRHEFTKYDCERWDYVYCIKTLLRSPPVDGCMTAVNIAWDRSKPWRILIASVPILSAPCLNIDEYSFTVLCSSDVCNDTMLDKSIGICSERYSRGVVHYIERPAEDSSPPCPQCPSCDFVMFPFWSALDVHLIVSITILSILLLHVVNTCIHSANMKRMRHEIRLNSPLPSVPQEPNVYAVEIRNDSK